MEIEVQSFDPWPDGMNLADAPHKIQDTQAVYLQDGLVDEPGIEHRRGPVQGIPTGPVFTKKLSGIFQTTDPLGNLRIAVLHGDNSTGKLALLNSIYTSFVEVDWNGVLPSNPPTEPYRIVDTSPGLTGGVWIGSSSRYDSNSPVQTLALWRGGTKVNYTTGTLSVTRGTTSVTGSGTSWLANASPGMFLFANTDDPYTNAYIGVVKSVNSDTSITLGAEALHGATAKAYTLQSIRGFCPRVVKGRITCTTASTTVTGANTKFKTQGLDTGVWQIYRASDLKFLGKVSSVTSDTSLTLTANSTTAMNNEKYYAFKVDGDFSINTLASTKKVGFLTAVYAERQWFANLGTDPDLTQRLWYSDTGDPEAVDLSAFDGDFLNLGSTDGISGPIRAIATAYNALVVLKENEAHGVFGKTPSQFELKKILDDGTLSAMSVQSHGGGVIWAGREGIHFYDGVETQNLTEKTLGLFYQNAVRSFNPLTYRMWSMIARDHYVLFIENCDPSKAVIKGVTSDTPNVLVIVLNLSSRAVTMFTNVHLRGAIKLPADSGEEVWYIVNDSTKGYICDAADLFDADANDAFATDGGGSLGPDWYVESKKYDMGDSLVKKLVRQIIINYSAQGDNLKVDTVVGLNSEGKTSNTELPASIITWNELPTVYATWDALSAQVPTWDSLLTSRFKPKKVKFQKRTTHFAFRLYQKSTSVTRVHVGPFQLGFKYLRRGKV